MTRKTYVGALDGVLKPMGFTRQGKEWTRRVGTVIEKVGLQQSFIAGMTVNLWSYDSETDALLKRALSWNPRAGMVVNAWRIGTLMDGYDRWWKDDPNGPTEMAEAVKSHAEPFFERRRSLEDQARMYGRAEPRWKPGNTGSRIHLALTLYRMGEIGEACAALETPPKTLWASALAEAESVRQWIGCPPRSTPDAPSRPSGR